MWDATLDESDCTPCPRLPRRASAAPSPPLAAGPAACPPPGGWRAPARRRLQRLRPSPPHPPPRRSRAPPRGRRRRARPLRRVPRARGRARPVEPGPRAGGRGRGRPCLGPPASPPARRPAAPPPSRRAPPRPRRARWSRSPRRTRCIWWTRRGRLRPWASSASTPSSPSSASRRAARRAAAGPARAAGRAAAAQPRGLLGHRAGHPTPSRLTPPLALCRCTPQALMAQKTNLPAGSLSSVFVCRRTARRAGGSRPGPGGRASLGCGGGQALTPLPALPRPAADRRRLRPPEAAREREHELLHQCAAARARGAGGRWRVACVNQQPTPPPRSLPPPLAQF